LPVSLLSVRRLCAHELEADSPCAREVGHLGTVGVVAEFENAGTLAEKWLAHVLPRRWRHVQSEAAQAEQVAKALSLPDDLVAAAWLHDIGYAPELAQTGFHPLDGARYLRRVGVDGQVASLVAYHSCAQIEADVRGLGAELAAEFSPANPLLTDALLYRDMTTGPDGDHVRPADRLAEIRARYGPDHVVTRFVELATPEISTRARRVAKKARRSAQVKG
jgi:HD domain